MQAEAAFSAKDFLRAASFYAKVNYHFVLNSFCYWRIYRVSLSDLVLMKGENRLNVPSQNNNSDNHHKF